MRKRASCRSSGRFVIPDRFLRTAILAGCFLIGVLAGFLFGRGFGGDPALTEYLTWYFSGIAAGGFAPNFWSVLWDLLRWPLIAAGLGLVRAGLAGIPLLLLVRGFLLSHAISVISGSLGAQGLLFALVLFGVSAFFVMPVLFLICGNGFSSAFMSVRGQCRAVLFSGENLAVYTAGAAFVLLAVAVQYAVMPRLLTALCGCYF